MSLPAWRLEEQARLRRDMDDPARVEVRDGVKRWRSNGAVIPPCVYDDAGVECPAAQRVAYSEELDAFLLEYRKNPPRPDAEQLAEMAAAFGPGEEVVDVITGRRTKLPGKKRKP